MPESYFQFAQSMSWFHDPNFPCFNCYKDRQISELLSKAKLLMEQLTAVQELAESRQETINAKDEQIKYLSEYIKSGGTKFFEDC